MRLSPRQRSARRAPRPAVVGSPPGRTLRLAILLLLVLGSPAAAVDGVVEVNQARALAGDITPGDLAGFPVTISRSGSYRLTGHLDVRGEAAPQDVTAISIEAPDVTIDLNGFAIIGPAVCSGTPATCSFAAPAARGVPLPGAGIGIDGNGQRNVAVFGGTVRGMGSQGLELGQGAIVRHLTASGNFGDGIRLHAPSIVTDCELSANGGSGVSVDTPAAGAVLTGNTVRGNGTGGMTTGAGALVRRNTSQRNGGAGISADAGSAVLENAARLNTAQGLNLVGAVGFGGNVLSANLTDAVQGGVEIGGNACNASSTCP